MHGEHGITSFKNLYMTNDLNKLADEFIIMRLSAGVPLPTVAANTDTSMKYIQEHYFHYRADESTEIFGKGRKIKPAEESLRWIGSI